jgi:serpin B
MNKKIIRILALSLGILTLMSCKSDIAPNQDNQPGGVTSPSDRPGDAPAVNTSGNKLVKIAALSSQGLKQPDGPSPSAQEAAKGANDFAFRFSSTLLSEMDTNDNFVCSPYSVWLPLAALLNATDEAARPALLDALGTAGLTAEGINNAASRMLYGLTNSRMNDMLSESGEEVVIDPLKIANAIFVDDDQTLNQDFAQIFADYYRGAAMNVDFASPDAAAAVNQWASDNTEGLIKDVIGEFDPDTVAAIANAIYFSDRWDWEFQESKTVEDTFHAPGGDSKAQFMVRQGDDLSYYEDDILQAMPLEFTMGGGMLILLPKDGDGSGLLRSFTSERFSEIMNRRTPRTGKLLLPRFEINGDAMNLMDTLKALNVPLVDPLLAPITGLLDDTYPLYISDAVQKAMIRVDEKGTTAAAVTVMAVAEAAAMMPEPTVPFEMNCNKPFAFVLYGRTYDAGPQVLFTGVVNQPE